MAKFIRIVAVFAIAGLPFVAMCLCAFGDDGQYHTPANTLVSATVYGAKWCIPCNRMKRDCVPGDSRIALAYTTDPAPLVEKDGKLVPPNIPCTIWKDADGRSVYLEGYQTLDQLWLRIQRNNPPKGESK